MASRRMITSAIWEDEWFGELDFFEQVLWIGLFSKCADDQGRLKDNAILIRASVFPYKDTDVDIIVAALECFEQAGRIIRYEANGKMLIQIVKWWEHQKPQWAAASQWEPPSTEYDDRIRTRLNGQYYEVNWKAKDNKKPTPKSSGERSPEEPSRASQVDGQYPVPVPVPIPIPIPVPEKIGTTESEKASDSGPPSKTIKQEMFDALVEACNVVDVTDKFRGWANRNIGKLLASGRTSSDILAFNDYWKSDEWRSQNNKIVYTAFNSKFDSWVSQGKPKDNGKGNDGKNWNGHASYYKPGGVSTAEAIEIQHKREAEEAAALSAVPGGGVDSPPGATGR